METGKIKEIKAVILAAGKGTRMKSDLPKVLHPIFQKPMLSWVIDCVCALPYKSETITVVGHRAECVKEFLNKSYNAAKTVVQKEQLGTGHAVAAAVNEIGDFEGSVIILCGDTPLVQTKSLEEFNRDYIKYTSQVAETCQDRDLSSDSMGIGTSAIIDTEIDGAVGMNSGIFNNPFIGIISNR